MMLLVGLWFANLLWYKPFNINQFYERAYIEFLWNDPEALSQTGVLAPFGFTSYESELTDVSPASTKRLAGVGRSNLSILKSYDREKLDVEEQVSYDALLWFLEVGVEGEPFLFHDYPVTQISGPHIDIPQFMRSHPLNNKRDIQNYLLRLEAIDDKFGSLIDGLEERRKLGIVAPTFIIQSATQYCSTIMEQEVKSSVFYKRFEQEITSISLLNPKSKQKYLDECILIIQETVLPAYKRLSGYLMQLERSSLSIAGVWQLPQGNEYYQYCLLQNTGLRNSPDELYEIGKMEMSRLKGELAVLLEMVGNDLDEMDPMLVSQAIDIASANSFPNTPEGRAHCVEFFNNQARSVNDKLEKYFSRLPTTEMQVLEVPEQSSANRPLAFYIPPRGTSPSIGKMYVNTWKASNLTEHLAKSYAFHEGIPGHHLQKGIQSELNNLPTFRRFLPFEAYTEGWAMYAEQLGHEMTESEDPWDRIGLIKSDLFRTARMTTDIGIHHKKWLRQQAVEFMVDNAGLSESEAKNEVDRYIVWPGQGCAYKVGQLKFLELRALAKFELKEHFDMREFHEVLIGQGAMPLKVLEERVREYLAQTKERIRS